MKSYKLYFVFAIVLVGFCSTALAQDNYIFTSKSRMLDNPAFAGTEKEYTLRLAYKSQWKDFNTQYLMFSGAATDRIGMGLSVNRENVFVQKNTALYADFSYNIPLNSTDKLYFGFKAGGDFKSLDASNLVAYNIDGKTANDHLLQSYSGKFQANIGVGIQYKAPKFYVGFGVPKLLITDEVEFDAVGRVTRVAEQFRMIGLVGYFWDINDTMTLKPYAKFVYKKSEKDQIEIATTFDYNKLLEVGLSYRIQESVSAFALVNIPKTGFQLGYGYQFYTSDFANYAKGSHEFVLQYMYFYCIYYFYEKL